MRAALIGVCAVVVLLAVSVAVLSRAAGGGREIDCTTVQLPVGGQWRTLPRDGQIGLLGDLERCSRFAGLTRAQVVSALGTPSEAGRVADGSPLLVYEVDNGRSTTGAPLQPDRLLVTLAADGRVQRTWIDRRVS